MELQVERAESAYNPHLYVSLKQGRCQLSTARAVYSYGDLYSNFSRAFLAMDLDRLPIRNVLILGLGLGSIPRMLEKVFNKSYHYTAVEIDEAVIGLAGKYGLHDLESGFELFEADALLFINQCSEQFDMICMDVFLDDLIPDQFETLDFLERLRDLLSPGGVLLFNRLAASRTDQSRSRTFFTEKFQKAFPSGTLLDVGGNYMLISRKDLLKTAW